MKIEIFKLKKKKHVTLILLLLARLDSIKTRYNEYG